MKKNKRKEDVEVGSIWYSNLNKKMLYSINRIVNNIVYFNDVIPVLVCNYVYRSDIVCFLKYYDLYITADEMVIKDIIE